LISVIYPPFPTSTAGPIPTLAQEDLIFYVGAVTLEDPSPAPYTVPPGVYE
jgi:hypothetical protein